jgi:ABC-type polysaccharide/polyol phosphate transport system ATPase subunit
MATPEDRPVRISVDNVGKRFRVPHERSNSLKQTLISFRKKGYEEFNVLRDINFKIYEGEFFGILGRNGSGKSTLLKLLAGIYEPTVGSITVNGNLTPFIELGVGFNPELSGRENVFLNGAILGLTTKEIEQKYDDIVAFAELERFMDQKLKNYSSGMLVRLAFSIAIQAHNGILLVDEVLAVGDERFQNKCLKVFAEIKKDPNKTVVFVSHDMGSVQRFCDRAMVVDNGDLLYIGDTDEAALRYKKLNFPESVFAGDQNDKAPFKLYITGTDGKRRKHFTFGEKIQVHLEWKKDERIKNAGVAIFRDDGQYIFGTNTIVDKSKVTDESVVYEFEASLGSAHYFVQSALFGAIEDDRIYAIYDGPNFSVSSPPTWQGTAFLEHQWRA